MSFWPRSPSDQVAQTLAEAVALRGSVEAALDALANRQILLKEQIAERRLEVIRLEREIEAGAERAHALQDLAHALGEIGG